MSSVPESDSLIVPARAAIQFARPDTRSIVRMVSGFFRASMKRVALWQEKRESRRILRHLTDAELKDIGVTRAEARVEVAKSFFWD